MERKGNLIKLTDLSSDFIIDLKYATPDNFTGVQVYQSADCWLDEHTAQILIKAKEIFEKDGYQVKIWDAYRPIRAQKRFWEIMPNDDFIARPPDMTKIKKFRPTHMNGMCVDVTLTDKEGNEIEMPSPFDTMDERASLNYSGHSETGRRNGEYLKQVMESVGFQAYECEWWHFYDVSRVQKRRFSSKGGVRAFWEPGFSKPVKKSIKDVKSVTLASSDLPRRETTRGTIAYRKNRKLGKPSTHD